MAVKVEIRTRGRLRPLSPVLAEGDQKTSPVHVPSMSPERAKAEEQFRLLTAKTASSRIVTAH